MAEDKPKYVVSLEWNNDERDFKIVKKPEEDSIYAIIDEEQEKIFLNFPAKTKLVTRRTVERRVKSIAKSGFEIADQNIRVGMRFNVVETGSDTVIPDILLQVGHEYIGVDEEIESSKIKRVKTVTAKPIKTVPPIEEQLQPMEEESKPLPPPKTPGKRRKKHMIKPTFSGSPIRMKEMEEETTVARESIVHKAEPPKGEYESAALLAEGIDPDTFGLGAVLRTFIEDSESIYIAKRGNNSFILESDSNVVEFKLSNGKPEFLRTVKSSKPSFNIKEFEKRLNKLI